MPRPRRDSCDRILPRWTAWLALAIAAFDVALIPTIYSGTNPSLFYSINGLGIPAAGGLFVLWVLLVSIMLLLRARGASVARRTLRSRDAGDMMPRHRVLSASAVVALLPVLAAGAWAPAKKLDAYLDALEKSQLVSGTLAITEKGELRYQRSIGFATIENGKPQPADAGTRYRAGPVSMLFTAVLVMQRAETASITLDTPLAEFFPDLPNALVITYRDLLGASQRPG